MSMKKKITKYNYTRIRGPHGGLNSVFISRLIGMSSHTCKKLLTLERKRLDRYITEPELGRFITEQITKQDLKAMRALL